VGYNKRSSKKEVHNDTGLPQETRKIPNKPSDFIPKGTRKRGTKPNISRGKEIIKTRVEINEIEIVKKKKR